MRLGSGTSGPGTGGRLTPGSPATTQPAPRPTSCGKPPKGASAPVALGVSEPLWYSVAASLGGSSIPL